MSEGLVWQCDVVIFNFGCFIGGKMVLSFYYDIGLLVSGFIF